MDGNVESWNIWLIAGGNRQKYSVDYNKTFAIAAKMPSIQLVLANPTQQNWEMHQIDIKSMYLNMSLDKEVYMLPPAGLLKPVISLSIQYKQNPIYFCTSNVSHWRRLITVHCTNMVPSTAHMSLHNHSLTLHLQVTLFTQWHFNLRILVHDPGHY